MATVTSINRKKETRRSSYQQRLDRIHPLICKLVDEREYTILQIAELCDVSYPTMHYYYKGRRGPNSEETCGRIEARCTALLEGRVKAPPRHVTTYGGVPDKPYQTIEIIKEVPVERIKEVPVKYLDKVLATELILVGCVLGAVAHSLWLLV